MSEVAVDPKASHDGLDILQDMRDSDGQARDLLPPQLEALRILFADPDVGLWWFCREIFGFKDMIWDFHAEPCQLVGHWGESHLADGTIIYETPKGGYEEDNVVDSYRRIMIRIPRETFKTSCFTRGAGLRLLAMKPESTLAIFNETQDKPLQWMEAIRLTVENSHLFQMIYRDIIPRGVSFWDRENGISTSRKLKWGSTGLRFERDSYGISELSIEPHGIGGTAVGSHYTHMIWDDIIGLKASLSPAVMDAAVEWVSNSRPLERPAEGGCVLVNHTRWAYSDVYRFMETHWPGEWKVFHRALLEHPETGDPDDVFGISTFPTKISTKKALQMRERDPFIFSSQYQNMPKAGKHLTFSTEHDGEFHVIYDGTEPVIVIDKTGSRSSFDGTVFEHDMENCPDLAPDRVPLSWCERSIIIDPAPSKPSEIKQSRNANNALLACALDPWGRRYNLDTQISKDGPTEVLEQVISMARTWQAWNWSVEEVVFSAVYHPLWSKIMSLCEDMQDCHPQWIPVFPLGRDKHMRIRQNLIQLHESGLMYYNLGDPKKREQTGPGLSAQLLKEKREFPHGETVDTLDAWSYVAECMHKPETPEAIQQAWWRNRTERRGITGYGEISYETS